MIRTTAWPQWATFCSAPLSSSTRWKRTCATRRATILAVTLSHSSLVTGRFMRMTFAAITLQMTPNQPVYWRDVGTLDAYYEANMDLRDIRPMLNLNNPNWPIRTSTSFLPPAKFVYDEDGRRGYTVSSIVSEGSIISHATVANSVLGRGVFVDSYSEVESWSASWITAISTVMHGSVAPLSIKMSVCQSGRRLASFKT